MRRLQVWTNRVLLAIREIQQYKLFLLSEGLFNSFSREAPCPVCPPFPCCPQSSEQVQQTLSIPQSMVWPIIKLFLFRILWLLTNWIGSYNISKKRTVVYKVVVLHVCLSKSNQVIFVSDTLILQKDYIFVLPTSCQIIFPPWSLWPGWTFKLSHPASLRWSWTFSGNSQIWQTVM